MRFIQLRSAPALNAGPFAASTTARTVASASRFLNALVSSATSASSKALRTSGRLSVRRATPPFFSSSSIFTSRASPAPGGEPALELVEAIHAPEGLPVPHDVGGAEHALCDRRLHLGAGLVLHRLVVERGAHL